MEKYVQLGAVGELARTIRNSRRAEGIKLSQQALSLRVGCHISFIAHLEAPKAKRIISYSLPSYQLASKMELVIGLEKGALWKKVELAKEEIDKVKALACLGRFYDMQNGDCETLSLVVESSPDAVECLVGMLPVLLKAVADAETRAELQKFLARFEAA